MDKINELEDHIMKCWNITDDIGFIWRDITDGEPMTDDELCNILMGLEAFYNRKFSTLFELYGQALLEKKNYIDYGAGPREVQHVIGNDHWKIECEKWKELAEYYGRLLEADQ